MPFQNFKLYSESSVTLCQQIEDGIKQQISQKTLLPGEKIPTMRVLSRDLNCGIVTVNRALMNLKEQDLLISKGNQGMFVADLSADEIELVNQDSFMEKLKEVAKEAQLRNLAKWQVIELFDVVYEEVAQENGRK